MVRKCSNCGVDLLTHPGGCTPADVRRHEANARRRESRKLRESALATPLEHKDPDGLWPLEIFYG